MHLRTLLLATLAIPAFADPPEPKFQAVTLDEKVQIGYGVAVADVDGDKLPDVLLADKKQFVWYKNPGGEKAHDPAAWTRYVLAENLTTNDNVCIAAQDIDGDGKCEVAVGAEWNPGDTVNSGAVFYLVPPADRTQKWEPVKFPSVEPTTHRMRWVNLEDKTWGLLVCPLHGRGNKNGEGVPVNVLLYHKPAGDPHGEWRAETIAVALHMTHNFLILPPEGAAAVIVVAGKEGAAGTELPDQLPRQGRRIDYDYLQITKEAVGEIRPGTISADASFYATVEPMHGNSLVLNLYGKAGKVRHLLTDKLTEGHALRCADLLGTGGDQIVVGWRGTPGKEGSTFGVHLWTPLDTTGEKWRDSVVDDTGMACEDLTLADLDGDGKLDIVASGRATHNLKVYFNQSAH